MLILLPPSEGKTVAARGRHLDLDRLSLPELGATRTAVLEAVARTSLLENAAERLGISPNLQGEIARNTCRLTAPTAAAGRVYSGVLHQALDLPSLDTASRRRAHRWLLVVSALFGAVRMGDRIPAYRHLMGVNLATPGSARGGVARPPLGDASGRGRARLVVDCRSSTYAVAWVPQGPLARRWVKVRVRGASHLAKHTRGLVARHLCEMGVEARSPGALAEVVGRRFDVALAPPAKAGQPWTLDASAR